MKNLAKNLGVIVGALAIGVIVPMILFAAQPKQTQTQNLPYENPANGTEYLKNQASLMDNSGQTMKDMADKMVENGRLMQQKGSQYNDSDLTQKGDNMVTNGQQMQTKGQDLLNSANDFSGKIQ